MSYPLKQLDQNLWTNSSKNKHVCRVIMIKGDVTCFKDRISLVYLFASVAAPASNLRRVAMFLDWCGPCTPPGERCRQVSLPIECSWKPLYTRFKTNCHMPGLRCFHISLLPRWLWPAHSSLGGLPGRILGLEKQMFQGTDLKEPLTFVDNTLCLNTECAGMYAGSHCGHHGQLRWVKVKTKKNVLKIHL